MQVALAAVLKFERKVLAHILCCRSPSTAISLCFRHRRRTYVSMGAQCSCVSKGHWSTDGIDTQSMNGFLTEVTCEAATVASCGNLQQKNGDRALRTRMTRSIFPLVPFVEASNEATSFTHRVQVNFTGPPIAMRSRRSLRDQHHRSYLLRSGACGPANWVE